MDGYANARLVWVCRSLVVLVVLAAAAVVVVDVDVGVDVSQSLVSSRSR